MTVEEEITNLEHAYWKTISEQDLPGYSEMLNDKLLAWTFNDPAPMNKEETLTMVQGDWANTVRGSTEVYVRQLREDCAAAFYDWSGTIVQKDPPGRVNAAFRVVHVWVHEEGKWTVVSGMTGLTTGVEADSNQRSKTLPRDPGPRK